MCECRLKSDQGEGILREGGLGSSRERIMRDESSNKDDVESARSLSEEEVVIRHPLMKKQARRTSENKTAKDLLRSYKIHQLFCPRCDEKMEYMYIGRGRVTSRVLAAEKRQTLPRLLKMEGTLKHNEGSNAPGACKDMKDSNYKEDRHWFWPHIPRRR